VTCHSKAEQFFFTVAILPRVVRAASPLIAPWTPNVVVGSIAADRRAEFTLQVGSGLKGEPQPN
jgi:hypothetical protein